MSSMQWNEFEKAIDYKHLKVTSPAFEEGELIPVRYTCDGENINPPLDIAGTPADARCMAVVVEDPDAPSGTFAHWVAWNIHSLMHIKEGRSMEAEGMNGFRKYRYQGPCPPEGTHRYYFKVYALDALLDLPLSATKEEMEKAMCEHIVGFGSLMGIYKRI